MKRFTETAKWDDPWFIRLPGLQKLLWLYICDRCDASGVIDFCPELASVQVGGEVTAESLQVFGDRVRLLSNGKWQIVKFLPFQYGTVDAHCPAHKPVIRLIEQNGLQYPINNLPDRVSDTLKEKDKDKEKEKKGESEGFRFPYCAGTLRSEAVLKKFNDEWVPCRKAMGKKPKDWNKMFIEQAKWLVQFSESDQLEILAQSIRNNWQGLFPPKQVVESKRSMSAFEIEKRSAAIGDEINKIFRRNGGKRLPGDGIDELKERRAQLQHLLVA